MAGTEDDADFAGMSLDADRNLLWTYQVRQGGVCCEQKCA